MKNRTFAFLVALAALAAAAVCLVGTMFLARLTAPHPPVGARVSVVGTGCTHPNPKGDEWIGGVPAPKCWDNLTATGIVEVGGGENAAYYGSWTRVHLNTGKVFWVEKKDLRVLSP